MMKFSRMLPALLTRTDVVLELRDARLPLTSINRTLEGALLFSALTPTAGKYVPNELLRRVTRPGLRFGLPNVLILTGTAACAIT